MPPLWLSCLRCLFARRVRCSFETSYCWRLWASGVPVSAMLVFNARRVCIARTMPWQDVCQTPVLSLNYRHLETWVRGDSSSLKMVPFESLGTVSYSPSTVTTAVSLAISETFSVKEWPDLEIWVVQGHWKWRSSIDHVWLSISPPL